MIVLEKIPGGELNVVDVKNKEETFREFLGGSVKRLMIKDDLMALCNAEMTELGGPENCIVYGTKFSGPVIFTGHFNGEPCDIPTSRVVKLCRHFRR